ncbi:MAG: hypothetical protein AB1499_14545 [Nitrospirota bacterium]
MTKKIIIISFLISSIILALSVPLHASDWNFVTMTTKYYYFIDSDSIITYDSKIIFWVAKVDIETGKFKARKKCSIDCDYETANVMEDIRYDADARIEKKISGYETNWYDVRKGRATQAIATLLCLNAGSREDIKKYLRSLFQIEDDNTGKP